MNIISHKSCISNKKRRLADIIAILYAGTGRFYRFPPAYKAKLYERAKGNFPVVIEKQGYILIGRLEHIAEGGTITLTSEQLHELQDTCFIRSGD